MVSLSLLPGASKSSWFGHSLRMFPRAAMLRIGRCRECGEEGWPVGAVLLTADMLRGGKDGPNFGVGMCSEIWLRWEGPPLCWHSAVIFGLVSRLWRCKSLSFAVT